MKQTKTVICAALAALMLAGLLPHAAFADGDKDKKKKGPVVVIGPTTITPDGPAKKK